MTGPLATANIFERVVRIERQDGTLGTGTVVDVQGSTFLLTAAHVLPSDPTEPISVSNRFRSLVGPLRTLTGIDPDLDLAVAPFSAEFALPDLPLPLGSAGLFYSQEVIFLGFPYGLSLSHASVGFLPFVKRATLSASEDVPGGKLWYLDGMNNPGFSGGPVVFAERGSNELRLFAVVSGYRRDWQDLYAGGQAQAALAVATNSGIVISFGVEPAVSAIEASLAPSP